MPVFLTMLETHIRLTVAMRWKFTSLFHASLLLIHLRLLCLVLLVVTMNTVSILSQQAILGELVLLWIKISLAD
ncbi:hypothetical protein GGI1_09218 [Acidithiobacillus sp. GGI-221]|nr:hypothetical protein GGI1_09218 [Acidithiobacillus sp. GGI-221]